MYSVALSLFVFQLTGSATLVGTMMGIVTIPRIILGPIAGAVIDRHSKKIWILLPDLVRGITISAISFLAYKNLLTTTYLLLAAIVDGICTSFFNPTMETVMPMIVEEKDLVQANSVFDMLTTGIEILGQSIGGALYNLLEAPLIFLINGLSYLFSAGTEAFISLPEKKERNHTYTIIEDMKLGMEYVWNDKGLIRLFVLSFFLNYLFGMIRVLIIPWFVNTNGFGEVRYGFFNGACSVGMIAGMFLLSMLKLEAQNKYKVYAISVYMFIVLVGISALINRFWAVVICFVLAFAFQIIFNTLMITTIILNTDEKMRGKVSATRITLCMAASPLGNFIGGCLGDSIAPNLAIASCSMTAIIITGFFISDRKVKEYFSKSQII